MPIDLRCAPIPSKMMEEYETEEARARGSLEFVESSILDTIVPAASDLSIARLQFAGLGVFLMSCVLLSSYA